MDTNLYHLLVHFTYQVFLHSPYEIPMVTDLGFAVPSGRHSLVTVKPTLVLRCICYFHIVNRFKENLFLISSNIIKNLDSQFCPAQK